MKLKAIEQLLNSTGIRIIKCLDTYFEVLANYDMKAYPYMKSKSRIYLQVKYGAVCTKTGRYSSNWTGRKWYLSEHMTEDEIIKTAFTAFKTAVEHEVLESFKVNGKALFNPHVDYRELLKVSDKEITRTNEPRKKDRIKLPGRKQR